MAKTGHYRVEKGTPCCLSTLSQPEQGPPSAGLRDVLPTLLTSLSSTTLLKKQSSFTYLRRVATNSWRDTSSISFRSSW